MLKKAYLILALAVLSGCTQAFAQLATPHVFSGSSNCAHHTCTWVPLSTHKTFQQGNLTYTVDAGGDFLLRREDKDLLRTPLNDLSASTSVVWSDDKRNFAVTWSDGGAIGGFYVRVFHIDGDSVTELPSTQAAFGKFKAHHWCETRGNNIQAYDWLADSRQLVLVLSVYPTSDCGKEMGHTEAYVVDAATGNIRQHWNVKQLNSYVRSHPEL